MRTKVQGGSEHGRSTRTCRGAFQESYRHGALRMERVKGLKSLKGLKSWTSGEPGRLNSSTGPLRDSLGGDPLGRFRAESTPGELEVVMRLEIHPELGCGAEEEARTERGVGTDAAAIVDDLRNAVGEDAERSR